VAREVATTSKPFGAGFVTAILFGAALNPINSSVIATGLVAIATAMDVPVGKTSILISSLYLTCAIAQPTAGRLAEEFGPRRVFLLGIALVLAGGVLGAVADNLATLVWARVLIGFGTSAGYPTGMMLIRRRATDAGLDHPPSTVLGGIAIAGGATMAIGPSLGGLLIGWFGWRSVFAVNLPFAVVAGLLVLWGIPRDPDVFTGRAWRVVISRLDLAGIAAFSAALVSALIVLEGLPQPRWPALVGAVVFSAGLVWRELRAANPFIDMRLLVRNRALSRTYLRAALTVFGTYVVLYGVTQWIEVAHGQTALAAGLIMLPVGAASALAAQAFSGRKNPRMTLIVAAVLFIGGSVFILMLSTSSSVFAIGAVTAIFGAVNGAGIVGNQLALYRQTPADTIGTASGLMRTSQYVSSIASAVLIGVVFSRTVDSAGLHHAAVILIGMSVVLLLMTLFDRRLSGSGSTATGGTRHRPGFADS
jgi:MFS family permease